MILYKLSQLSQLSLQADHNYHNYHYKMISPVTLTGEKISLAWKEVARHPPLPAGPAGPAGAAPEEHLLRLRKATAAGLVLEHMHVLVCICAHLVPEQL